MDAIEFLRSLQDDGLLVRPINFEMVARSSQDADQTIDTWLSTTSWRDDGHSFETIGQDSTGGQFALWTYPKLVGEPPVVVLGSESEATIVAASALDFAQQLCDGQSWMRIEKAWHPIHADAFAEAGTADIVAIRARAAEALGPVSESAGDMRVRAVATHPDFSAWVEETADDLKATVEIPGRR